MLILHLDQREQLCYTASSQKVKLKPQYKILILLKAYKVQFILYFVLFIRGCIGYLGSTQKDEE